MQIVFIWFFGVIQGTTFVVTLLFLAKMAGTFKVPAILAKTQSDKQKRVAIQFDKQTANPEQNCYNIDYKYSSDWWHFAHPA